MVHKVQGAGGGVDHQEERVPQGSVSQGDAPSDLKQLVGMVTVGARL